MPITPEQAVAARFRLAGVDSLWTQMKDAIEHSWAFVEDKPTSRALRQEYNRLKASLGTALDNLFDPIPDQPELSHSEYLAAHKLFDKLGPLRNLLANDIQTLTRPLCKDEDGNLLVDLPDKAGQVLRDEAQRLRDKIKAQLEALP